MLHTSMHKSGDGHMKKTEVKNKTADTGENRM